ncbi:MAG: type I DNA topoisomerase, partial [Candidatus Yonathbacteria bacterium]|nr:type I DNA topoisomerase [Candidatus Yonathbacteria bacterium]
MKLVIVESPAKTKTVGKYLGKEYTVTSSVGHVRDLPKSNKKAIDIKAGFVPHYEISKGKERVVDEIRKLAKKATEVYLATDPDREGEAIAWHVAEAADIKNPKRIVFNEITESAVKEAILHPREIDEHLLKAQEARRVLDRLFGYDLSGLIWKKVRYGLSAGRVQSPALRIIMEREREIRAFNPETYWVITADVKKGDVPFALVCSEEPRDKKEVDRILLEGRKEPWAVTEIKETEQKRSPRPPFITSTLQQTASSRLGFAPSKTMGVAQKLYEAGLITYMRTDSPTLSKDAEKQIDAYIRKEYGAEFALPRTYKTTSKSAQEAHEAIRPTSINKETAGGSEEQKKLYQLIWARAVASQMVDARLLKTRIVANITPKTIPDFA